MSASQDFVALDWIKADISETLTRAQQSLEVVAEQGDDPSSMRACLTALHQVHGTLKMVEIEGPVLVAAEMEALAQALMNEEVPDVGHAQELLMQTILQMPGYLDRIQREQQDNPQFVRPTVNNLRVSRGAEKLAGSDDAGQQASVFSVVPEPDLVAAYSAAAGPATIRKLRVRYQKALGALLKKQSPKENLSLLAKVLQMQSKLCKGAPTGYFAEVMIALVEGVLTGALRLDNKLAGQLRKYDALLKVLSEGSEEALSTSIPVDFQTEVQVILDGAAKSTPRIDAAKALFTAADNEAISLTEQVEFGPDDDTVAAVSKILIEELAGVTDRLDLYVRSANREISQLVELVPAMEQIASTLLVVGKNEHQQSILRQIAIVRGLEANNEQPNDDQLLDIAGALLEISSDLNRLVGDVDDDGETDSFGDLDEAQATVIRETRNGLARSKDAVIEYISNDFAKDKLETLAENLRSLGSGLSIVNQQRCADVLASCSRYVDEKLLGRDVQPTLAEMDDLADAITSIDYFLERLLESTTDPYWQMVEVAETAIAKLGYAVNEELSSTVVSPDIAPVQPPMEVAEPTEEAPPTADEISAELAEAATDADLLVAEDAQAEPEVDGEADREPELDADVDESLVAKEEALLRDKLEVEDASSDDEVSAITAEPEPQAAQPEAGDGSDDDLIDEEILEIFIEEAEEVLDTLREYLPIWREDVSNSDALTEVRRAFHTLKGSGRMVGATVVGELAWAIEDMLNRVLDNTIEASAELFALLDEVIASLPD
ncbi:MAG: Hpt domain-containing protein, partial [Pseudomonadales bacterium]